jgi:hypothetical protein
VPSRSVRLSASSSSAALTDVKPLAAAAVVFFFLEGAAVAVLVVAALVVERARFLVTLLPLVLGFRASVKIVRKNVSTKSRVRGRGRGKVGHTCFDRRQDVVVLIIGIRLCDNLSIARLGGYVAEAVPLLEAIESVLGGHEVGMACCAGQGAEIHL